MLAGGHAVDPAMRQLVAEVLTGKSQHDADQVEPLRAQIEVEVQTF